MSLTRIQRDAMASAQAGHWLLGDAMELMAPGRQEFDGYALLWGINRGGRLHAFAYGLDDAAHECGIDDLDLEIGEVRYVVTLNGDVVYDFASDDDMPPWCRSYLNEPAMTVADAEQTLITYRKTALDVVQQSFLPEPA